MQRMREMPEGFAAFAVILSQEELCRKYSAGTTTVQRWRQSLGIDAGKLEEIRKAQASVPRCRYRGGLDCPDCSGCAFCGWNPMEEARIKAVFLAGGMEAVRLYAGARKAAAAEVTGTGHAT